MKGITSDGTGGFATHSGGAGLVREFGFYPSTDIWAGSPVVIVPGMDPWVFTGLMEEEVYRHRSAHFDLRVCRDGLIMLQVTGLEAEWPTAESPEALARWWGKYIEVVNCAHLLLDAAVLEEMNLSYGQFAEITRSDVLIVRFNGGSVTSISGGSATALRGKYLERYLSLHAGNDGIRLFHRQSLDRGVFPALSLKLECAIKSKETVRYLATIARGVAQYKIGNYQVSLVLAWFVIESILFAKWRAHLEGLQRSFAGGEKRINKERMEALEGRDYPASVVTSLLELEGRLDFDSYRKIDRVRRNRNKVVHQDAEFECRAEHCKEALLLAAELAMHERDFTCPINLSYAVGS
jgi:hypothetical protein